MFGRRKRPTTDSLLAALVKNAQDPRRQNMAEIIEAVLKGAGFAKAEIDTSIPGDYPSWNSKGFWMRVDSIGPGILLTYSGEHDYGIHQAMVDRYYSVLRQAFQPVLGADNEAVVLLDTETEWYTLTIMLPSNRQLQRLQSLLVR